MHIGRNGRALRLHRWALSAAAVLGTSTLASADLADNLSDVVFEITASNAEGSATFQVTQGMGSFVDDMFFWNLAGAMDLIDPDTLAVIATIDASNVFYQGDPIVAMGFGVTAGQSDTTFSVTSGLLSFDTSPLAEASVNAGLTLTDNGANGGTMSGIGGNFASFQYNGQAPGGTVFANLTGPDIVVGPGGSDSASADTGGFLPIGEPVSNMSSLFNFMVTAGDSASATSSFVLNPIPAPAALALLAGTGLLGRRRRRV